MMSIAIGVRFERLIVIDLDPPKRKRRALCRCDCGEIKSIATDRLLSGNTRSCGCLRRELTTNRNTTHGITRNKGRSPTYYSWIGMKERCLSPAHQNHDRYGGRGIRICDRWLGTDGFANFVADMGERPPGTSIDRINNDSNYEPGNCRWASQSAQVRNSSTSKLKSHQPEQIRWMASLGCSQSQIGEIFGIAQSTVSAIIRRTSWC